MVGMCDKPAAVAATPGQLPPIAGVDDSSGGIIDVGTGDDDDGGDDE